MLQRSFNEAFLLNIKTDYQIRSIKNVLQFSLSYVGTLLQFHVLELIFSLTELTEVVTMASPHPYMILMLFISSWTRFNDGEMSIETATHSVVF